MMKKHAHLQWIQSCVMSPLTHATSNRAKQGAKSEHGKENK